MYLFWPCFFKSSLQLMKSLNKRVLPLLIWHIFQIIVNLLSLIMSAYALNMHILKDCLQSNNFKRLLFVSRKWSNDLRVDCKPLSNPVKMIKKDFDFEEESERFEGSFERDEPTNIYNVDKIHLIFMFLKIYIII